MADLVPATPNGSLTIDHGTGPMAQVKGFVAQPAVRKMLPWFIGTAGLGLAALTWALVVPAPQRMLYSSLGDGERAEVAAALDQAGIAYQIDPGTGAVMVGEDELYRARMTVASQGALSMPESGSQMLDSLPMGASRTLEGDRLRAAQERELELTIAEIDGVDTVRVHLAKADKSVFVRENGDPTASVMLRLARGKALTQSQVGAIANLVAASVVGLSPDHVRIVDQNGSLLSDTANPDMDGLDLQARTEAKLREQVIQLLSPVVGDNAFSAEVQVSLDMNEQTRARESYEPEGVVRSETVSETTQAEQGLAAGVPGATSNIPPADAQAANRAPEGTEAAAGGVRNGASNASRTFDVGREVSVTSSRPGAMSRLSVAVAIDESALGDKPEQEIKKLEELVSAAVGADPRRGDIVTVRTRAFNPAEIDEPAFWETPWFATILRNVVALLSVVLVLLLAVRPLLKAVTNKLDPSRAAKVRDDDDDNASDDDEALDEDGTREIEREDEVPALLPHPAADHSGPPRNDALSQQIELARRITREQPDDALQALRRMLREVPPAPEPDEAEAA
ncbi:flagellar M-ring protein FliF [Aurantiacibacter xanthus]|uniref:Flagellar M-ring protein n=1 Tax=Aurantiacibacter xanthus TaxID=1784712 RepID=A0A3A1P081_9SPHN|nr:flagellar basal-body MS-ring/collar protein FliF [Aurantiacibacter xanthus]RIV81338.1 flagellar M-ring protein FliF [Aurantiacibacter xanthus]